MDKVYIFLWVALLFGAFNLYFIIARYFNIVDLPNHRTMHEGATIRGGGVVVWLSALTLGVVLSFNHYFIAALVLIGITGFMDDLFDLNRILRFVLQGLAVGLLLYALPAGAVPLWAIGIVFVISVGVLNAFNFMDGINGITGGYTTVLLLTFIFINQRMVSFTQQEFLYGLLASVMVFNFYNFRKRARCFAGDVGSLSIAFIALYLVLSLILTTGEWVYVLFLLLYGIDTIFTILHRMYMRENIFQAHRSHLFQVAVRATGMPHVRMTWIYMLLQAGVNVIVISIIHTAPVVKIVCSVAVVIIFSIVYIVIKKKLWHSR